MIESPFVSYNKKFRKEIEVFMAPNDSNDSKDSVPEHAENRKQTDAQFGADKRVKEQEQQVNEQKKSSRAGQTAHESQHMQEDKSTHNFKNQFLRVTADFANYKRRMEQERSIWIKAGKSSVITSFLSCIDDIERALDAVERASGEGESKLLEGLQLIQKNMSKVLQDLGVKKVDCSGQFNPTYHEALLTVKSKDHKTGEIVGILSAGYELSGSVLRHAQVSVAQ